MSSLTEVKVVNNQNHYYFEFGDSNATDDNTIVMIGGIPTNPMESMSWLAGELIKLNSKYRILIFNIPFYENHFDIELSNTFATTNTINLIIKKSIDNKKLRVDPKYSHENQGIKVNDFLDKYLKLNNVKFTIHSCIVECSLDKICIFREYVKTKHLNPQQLIIKKKQYLKKFHFKELEYILARK